jgi:very-short-patch-repair endonuclease
LRDLGYFFVRFQDEDVLNDIENVRLEIEHFILKIKAS